MSLLELSWCCECVQVLLKEEYWLLLGSGERLDLTFGFVFDLSDGRGSRKGRE